MKLIHRVSFFKPKETEAEYGTDVFVRKKLDPNLKLSAIISIKITVSNIENYHFVHHRLDVNLTSDVLIGCYF